MDTTEPSSKKKSLIQVSVAPKKHPSRWRAFFDYFKELASTPIAEKWKRYVQSYMESQVEGGIEATRSAGAANAKIEAEVGNILKKTEIAEDENRRKNSTFELELKSKELDNQKKEAEINKLNAESLEMKVDAQLKLMDALDKKGFKLNIDIDEDGSPTLTVISAKSIWIDTATFSPSEHGSSDELDSLRSKARIPYMEGTAGDVLATLQKRIGKKALGISEVAKDMQLSKRTLQRRLGQQMVSYADLRNRVRFNRAIDCLLFENMSIEQTSKYLDFSSRTDFTNYFKRWTNMSPSTFQKKYRDFI